MTLPSKFRPMLAAKEMPRHPHWPMLASPKIDGIRALVIDGVVLSRTLKPIPNQHVQSIFGRPEFNGFDGELAVGDPADKNLMQNTTSGVMSKSGEPDVSFLVFDNFHASLAGFWQRFRSVCTRIVNYSVDNLDIGIRVIAIPHLIVNSPEELAAVEADWLQEGFEGVMLRDPRGLYKYGRSTPLEGGLIKVKRYEDAEAVVVGVNEMLHNGNEAQEDAFGRVKRSSAKAGLQPKGCMGELVCARLCSDGAYVVDETFNIGTGFTQAQREWFWVHRDEVIRCGTVVKFKHFTQTGVVDKPRSPVFIGIRHKEDM